MEPRGGVGGRLVVGLAAWCATALGVWWAHAARWRRATRTDAEWLRTLNDLRSLASRKNAVRGQCAAIVVKGGTIRSWGYARSLVRAKRPSAKANERTDLHAEADAVTAAALNGISLDGCTLYCTIMCCRSCFALVAAAGITRVVTPAASCESVRVSHGEHNLLVAECHAIDVCDTAVMPPYEPVTEVPLLPALRRRIPQSADGVEAWTRPAGMGASGARH